jgi:hypothetical protein
MKPTHVTSVAKWLELPEIRAPRIKTPLSEPSVPRARHSSIRFVAGELDPMATREAFLMAAQQVNDPIMVVYGAETPPKSRAEMEAWWVCRMLWPPLCPMQNWPCTRNSPTK